MRTPRELCPLVLCGLSVLCCASPPQPTRPLAGLGPTPACFEWVVGTLAAEQMEGRAVGGEGIERAARFIEQEFRELGLEPRDGSYRQPFRAPTRVLLGRGSELQIAGIPARLGSDFIPLHLSAAGEFSGPLVFVGYGIRVPELGYDDYSGVDVTGKLVLAMRYEPGSGEAGAPTGGARPSLASDLAHKARWAHEAGARALILMRPPGDTGEDQLPLFRPRGPLFRAQLPVLQVQTGLIEHLLRRHGYDLTDWRRAIDRERRPRSRELAPVELSGRVDVSVKDVAAANVVGVLPGRGELAQQVVVIGAHYDHLGTGGVGARTPDLEAVHPGADDNASGVSAMLCGLAGGLPRWREDPRPRRTLLAVAFSAGEFGSGGSSRILREPVFPLEKTVAMLNLHLLGHLSGAALLTPGSDSSPAWEPVLSRLAPAAGVDWTGGAGSGAEGPSDELPFLAHGIPALRLTTGVQARHHTPEDEPSTLDLEGGARVASLLQQLSNELLTRAERPGFSAPGAWQPGLGDVRGSGVHLGTIPDLSRISSRAGGVALAAVGPRSPAERAGIRGGDYVIEMAGIPIPNLPVMTRVLQDARPGETMPIVVLRGGERLRFWARLEAKGGRFR